MIPFLRLILCLHLVLLPPASYLPFHPSSILCIDSLYSLSVYWERKQWDECAGHCQGHFRCILFSPPIYPTFPPAPSAPHPSSAPWLCVGNERSRHVLSGLRPWKAGRQSEVKQGEAALAWTHTPLWAWDRHQKAQPEVFEERLRIMERERN